MKPDLSPAERTALRRRPAARLLVTDPLGRILLFRFDHRRGALAGTSYWATPGGGLEESESFEQAAIRELHEETGNRTACVGRKIASRETVLQIATGEFVLEEECYFHVAVACDRIAMDGWTADERECMTQAKWWTWEEVEASIESIFPENLLDMLAAVRSVR